MKDDCQKYEPLLSGYLDSRLSADEKAKVEQHLEKCRECRTFLKKLEKLDRDASSAIDEIDDSLLDQLELRIMSEIGERTVLKSPAVDRKKKIIPVWYRYIAVAASLVLVSLIGKMAYDGSFRGMLEPAEPSTIHRQLENKGLETESFQVVPDKGTDPDEETAKRGGRAEETGMDAQPDEIREEAIVETPMEFYDLNQAPDQTKAEPKTEDNKPAPPPPAAAEDLREESGWTMPETVVKSKAAQVGISATGDVQTKKKSVPTPLIESDLGKSIKVDGIYGSEQKDESKLAADKIDDTRSVQSMVGNTKLADISPDFIKDRSPEAAREKPSYVEVLKEKIEKKDNSLELHYATKIIQALDKIEAAGENGIIENIEDSLFMAASDVLGLAKTRLDIANAMLRVQYLYFAARASFDMHRYSGNKQYLEDASAYREKALGVIYYEKEKGNRSRFVTVYKDELENWDFKR